MRFSHVIIAYFMMGVVVVFATGIPVGQLGVASVFVDVTDSGDDVSVNETSVGGQGGDGMLDNLIGPVKNALNTITGGALLAVWGPISILTGYYAWPVTVLLLAGAPTEVVAIGGVFVAAFTFGVMRVFRASI